MRHTLERATPKALLRAPHIPRRGLEAREAHCRPGSFIICARRATLPETPFWRFWHATRARTSIRAVAPLSRRAPTTGSTGARTARGFWGGASSQRDVNAPPPALSVSRAALRARARNTSLKPSWKTEFLFFFRDSCCGGRPRGRARRGCRRPSACGQRLVRFTRTKLNKISCLN